jgi:hypothetical protein
MQQTSNRGVSIIKKRGTAKKMGEGLGKQTALRAGDIRFVNFQTLTIQRVLLNQPDSKKKAGDKAGLSHQTLEIC